MRKNSFYSRRDLFAYSAADSRNYRDRAVYYVGGYFADMTFRRGMPGYPKAPPAVFRTVFVSNGGAMQPAAIC